MAATDIDASTAIVHVEPAPAQAPPQPRKTDPGAGVAVSVIGLPPASVVRGNCAEQIEPQSIPGGELVTVPFPVPVFATVSVM